MIRCSVGPAEPSLGYLNLLRRPRASAPSTFPLEADLLTDDDTDTTLFIGHWTFAGADWATEGQRVLAGADWATEGQRVLADAAAARAREYDQWTAERRTEENSGEGTR